MPANQTYSARVHSRRQLGRANEHLAQASLVLYEIKERYKEALPQIAQASDQCNDMIAMLQTLIEDMRTNI